MLRVAAKSCKLFLLFYMFSEPGGVQKRSFTALAVVLTLLSILFLVFEFWLRFMMRERQKYFFDYETVIRAGVFLLTIVFVFGYWNDCWCAPPWQWQIGALAVFLAYINIILLLKGMPIIGVPINMLLNIVFTFLRLIYLPFLLIFAFAIPFYMLFVRDGPAVLVSLSFLMAVLGFIDKLGIEHYKVHTRMHVLLLCRKKMDLGFWKPSPPLLTRLLRPLCRQQGSWTMRLFSMRQTCCTLPWPTSSSSRLWCLCQFCLVICW